MPYGEEVIVDLHECRSNMFDRETIMMFLQELCEALKMERCELHFWDDLETPEYEKETEPHLVGTSAIQFITTSNITIHTLDILKAVYLNVFSCSAVEDTIVKEIAVKWFGGIVVQCIKVIRT